MILKLNSAFNSKQTVRAWNMLMGLGNYQTFTPQTSSTTIRPTQETTTTINYNRAST